MCGTISSLSEYLDFRKSQNPAVSSCFQSLCKAQRTACWLYLQSHLTLGKQNCQTVFFKHGHILVLPTHTCLSPSENLMALHLPCKCSWPSLEHELQALICPEHEVTSSDHWYRKKQNRNGILSGKLNIDMFSSKPKLHLLSVRYACSEGLSQSCMLEDIFP